MIGLSIASATGGGGVLEAGPGVPEAAPDVPGPGALSAGFGKPPISGFGAPVKSRTVPVDVPAPFVVGGGAPAWVASPGSLTPRKRNSLTVSGGALMVAWVRAISPAWVVAVLATLVAFVAALVARLVVLVAALRVFAPASVVSNWLFWNGWVTFTSRLVAN